MNEKYGEIRIQKLNEPANILLVDDRPENLFSMEEILKPMDQNFIKVGSGSEALKCVLDTDFAVIVMDVQMPGMDGFETAAMIRGRERSRYVPIIFLTAGSSSEADVFQGYAVGAVDYIIKPFVPEILRAKIATFVELYRMRKELQGMNEMLEERVEERTRELRESYTKLRSNLEQTAAALAATLEKRDQYTAGHQQRVAKLACAIAEEMGVCADDIEGLRVAGVLHDIGKIYVPAEILAKPGRLAKGEFAMIREHPEVGHDILAEIDFPWPVADIVLQHHEKMDGSGYPNGLKGEAILSQSRIVMVADVMEAMSSHRPYRPALGLDVALAEIEKNRGILYDDDVVAACIRLFREKGFVFRGSQ